MWYIAMTHVGFAALVAMFLLLAGNDLTASFAAMRSPGASRLGSLLRNVDLSGWRWWALAPRPASSRLHVWLPMAHPVAPSHVSALMSGVVIKMGIYGIVRVVLDLLGGGPAWWGGVVLGIGAVSALLGVLYALMEHDLKRLLAYHSVENIGIILIGVGAGLVFHSYGMMTLAALGLIGGLYHTINHASFKGLLFLGAGSVLHATHTRNMEEMGGLIKRMPWTAVFFLIGAAAISALPPLNGFVSEWLVFQALLGGFSYPVPEVAVLMPLAVGAVGADQWPGGGLFCQGLWHLPSWPFRVRTKPNTPTKRRAPCASAWRSWPLACVGLGVAPFVVVPLLGQAIAGLGGLPDTQAVFTFGAFVQTPADFRPMSTTWLAVGCWCCWA